jgi:hypothetical protein
MRNVKQLLAAMAGLVWLAGCATTPEGRIARDPALFATFPPEVQANVRQGKIAVGYTKDMVALALGHPQRMHNRTTQAGTTEIWSYTGVEYSSQMEPVETGAWYRDRRGHWRRTSDLAWVDVRHTHEYVVLRVEFEGDKVKAIETLR